MKYCVKCGSPMNNDAKFCAKCGTAVINEAEFKGTPPIAKSEDVFHTINEKNDDFVNAIQNPVEPISSNEKYCVTKNSNVCTVDTKQKNISKIYEKYSLLLNIATITSLLAMCISFVFSIIYTAKCLFQYQYLYEYFSITSLGFWANIISITYSFLLLSAFFSIKKKRNIYINSINTDEICRKFELQHTSITVLLVLISIVGLGFFSYCAIAISNLNLVPLFFVVILSISAIVITIFVIKLTNKKKSLIIVNKDCVTKNFFIKHIWGIIETVIAIIMIAILTVSITSFYNPVNILKNTRISGDIITERPVDIPYENTVGDLLNTYKNCEISVEDNKFSYIINVVAEKDTRYDKMSFVINKGQFFFLSKPIYKMDLEIYKGALVDENVMIKDCTFQDTDFTIYTANDSSENAAAFYLICVERFDLI